MLISVFLFFTHEEWCMWTLCVQVFLWWCLHRNRNAQQSKQGRHRNRGFRSRGRCPKVHPCRAAQRFPSMTINVLAGTLSVTQTQMTDANFDSRTDLAKTLLDWNWGLIFRIQASFWSQKSHSTQKTKGTFISHSTSSTRTTEWVTSWTTTSCWSGSTLQWSTRSRRQRSVCQKADTPFPTTTPVTPQAGEHSLVSHILSSMDLAEKLVS